MQQTIANVTLLVKDYDVAIHYYTTKLKFELIDDTEIGNGLRWVRIAPAKSNTNQANNVGLVLSKVVGQQLEYVGKQAGEGVFLFLQTDDFWADYHKMLSLGVTFLETPREEVYATVAVFEDLYGNKWDLLQSKNSN